MRTFVVEATAPDLAGRAARACMEALRAAGIDAGFHPTWEVVAGEFRSHGGLRVALAGDPSRVTRYVADLLDGVRTERRGQPTEAMACAGGWLSARMEGEAAGLPPDAMDAWLAAWGKPQTAFADGGRGPTDRAGRMGLAHADARASDGGGCVFSLRSDTSATVADTVAHARGHGDFALVTSNAGKWREFTRLGLRAGRVALDLPEVEAGPMDVALQKSRVAGPLTLVEDTSLDVEGASVGVNVRWLLDSVASLEGRPATWRVLLAANDGRRVRVSEGAVHGRIVRPSGPGGFGFDPVFAPDGSGGMTLADLEGCGRKDSVSARALAVRALVTGAPPVADVPLDGIPEWTGQWQAHDAPAP